MGIVRILVFIDVLMPVLFFFTDVFSHVSEKNHLVEIS